MSDANWFKKHCQGLKIIFDVSDELNIISDSFYIVGNNKMSEKLMYLAKILEDAEKIMRDAVSEYISIDLKRSQEMSATILKATLAGCIISKKGANKNSNTGASTNGDTSKR